MKAFQNSFDLRTASLDILVLYHIPVHITAILKPFNRIFRIFQTTGYYELCCLVQDTIIYFWNTRCVLHQSRHNTPHIPIINLTTHLLFLETFLLHLLNSSPFSFFSFSSLFIFFGSYLPHLSPGFPRTWRHNGVCIQIRLIPHFLFFVASFRVHHNFSIKWWQRDEPPFYVLMFLFRVYYPRRLSLSLSLLYSMDRFESLTLIYYPFSSGMDSHISE